MFIIKWLWLKFMQGWTNDQELEGRPVSFVIEELWMSTIYIVGFFTLENMGHGLTLGCRGANWHWSLGWNKPIYAMPNIPQFVWIVLHIFTKDSISSTFNTTNSEITFEEHIIANIVAINQNCNKLQTQTTRKKILLHHTNVHYPSTFRPMVLQISHTKEMKT